MHSLRLHAHTTAIVCALILVGCIPETPVLPVDETQQTEQPQQTQQTQQPEQVLSANAPQPPVQEKEPNDDFDHAQAVTLSESIEINGRLSASSTTIDQDFYALGPVNVGDAISGELDIDFSDDV